MRAKSHRSLRQLQQATFASDSSLSRYLSGRTVPPWQVVEALCGLGDRDPAEMRALWELARQARGRRADPARTSGVPPAAQVVPMRDSPAREAAAARGRTVFGLVAAAAAAVGLAAVFIRHRRPAAAWEGSRAAGFGLVAKG